ncbi:PTS mannitol transporter subunit IICB [Actinotalea sp. K2]|uniref:PTS mannitol transporter subunit IICB n=1 Tax=Actinotalea sp. K2 TaxID=2939438 RepID=UPI00201768D5|nr:PTS mannitol transporter subunit IICB [Actinotalea sp. K2]MCL3859964.1 PTS mannitol transporter subunit IICB [Actinotalea sp. K2]
MSEYTPTVTGTGAKARVQKVGGYLAGMVMPNIGAFIAWGLITAIFIEVGWFPVDRIGGFGDYVATDAGVGLTGVGLVGPMIYYLLPLLIGYTGGRMVHGQRGGVVGAIATVGVIVGTGVPMFLGAMAMGPLTAWIVKKIDEFVQHRTKAGFEMLVDNFTAGIVGAAMAIAGLVAIGPIVDTIMGWAERGVGFLVDNSLLPLASLIIEPGKVLFLNNAINHGVLTPLGAAQSQADGKSILFMLETNPGPGLGILLAFMFFGPRLLRPSTPAAIVIHFFGGIHEIYFPYILMKPQLVAAAILGGAAGILTNIMTGSGLVASPAPGSIFAYMLMTPRGGHLAVLLGIAVAAAVSFVVAALLLGLGRKEPAEADDDGPAASEELEAARAEAAARKAASKGAVPAAGTAASPGPTA